jgi:hypothetical protein
MPTHYYLNQLPVLSCINVKFGAALEAFIFIPRSKAKKVILMIRLMVKIF